jgi:HlyD family secretion protein
MGPNGKPVPQPPSPPLAKGTGRVYLVTDDKPGEEKAEPKIIQIGVTDGINTEVTGGLPAGAKIVTDEIDDDSKKKKGKFF